MSVSSRKDLGAVAKRTCSAALSLGLVCLMVGATLPLLLADDAAVKRPDPNIQELLSWLPEDTDTVGVAQKFLTPGEAKPKNAFYQSLDGELMDGNVGSIFFLCQTRSLEPVSGCKVKTALIGARKIKVVTKFSMPLGEACAIIRFDRDLGDAASKWSETLRSQESRELTLGTHPVFVLPVKEAPSMLYFWSPAHEVYFLQLKPDTILCATDERYLKEVFERSHLQPKSRALPDTLPEWKSLDASAPVWMVRHLRQPSPENLISGVSWSWFPDRFEVVYYPSPATSDELQRELRRRWILKEFGGTALDGKAREDFDRIRIARRKDGGIIVSSSLQNLGGFARQCFAINFFHVQAEGAPYDGR
jgi:hypothetical protein